MDSSGKSGPVVSPQGWQPYAAQRDGQRISIMFDSLANAQQTRAEFPRTVRLTLPILHPQGLPDLEESNLLNQVEGVLIQALETQGIPCRLVGRTTRARRRDVFIVTSAPEAVAALGAEVTTAAGRPARIAQMENWAEIDRTLWPSGLERRWIADLRVLMQLRGAGSDLTRPHALDFFFHGLTPQTSEALQARLRERGFTLPVADPEKGTLMMRKQMVPDLDALAQETWAAEQGAAEQGAVFDGWGAPVVPPA